MGSKNGTKQMELKDKKGNKSGMVTLRAEKV
jgi:hypothetical protein